MSVPDAAPRGRELLWLIAGFTLWFAVLCAVYGLHAWGCAAGWARGPLMTGLGAAVALSMAVLLAAWWRWRAAWVSASPVRWWRRASVGGAGGAAAATLFSLAVPLLLTPCIG